MRVLVVGGGIGGLTLAHALLHRGIEVVVLEQARNVRYRSFLAPGSQITYTVEAKRIEDKASQFQGTGQCGDQRIVEARFSLRHFNLAERNQALAATDQDVIGALKRRWQLLEPRKQETEEG